MMANVEQPDATGPRPDDKREMPTEFEMWGGPVDGTTMAMRRCEHGDWPSAEIASVCRRKDGQIEYDGHGQPVQIVSRYEFQPERLRYEFTGWH